MGFLGRFLDKRKIFLGLYEENFLNSEEFLRAAEDFPASANAFSKQYQHLSNLKNH
jgi:hypothetical protein